MCKGEAMQFMVSVTTVGNTGALFVRFIARVEELMWNRLLLGLLAIYAMVITKNMYVKVWME